MLDTRSASDDIGSERLELPVETTHIAKIALSEHFILYTAVIGYVVACYALIAYGYPEHQFSLLIYSEVTVTISVALLLLFAGTIALRIMVLERPRQLTKAIVEELKDVWFTKERLIQGAPLIVAFMFFISCFSSMKSMIPVVQPYSWDTLLHQWDLALHAQTPPWRLTHALFGGALATFLVNVGYNLWFPVMLGVFYWQIFTKRALVLRSRFLFSFFLCWIFNGTVLATFFSSAGPCFYGLLHPDAENPYAPLMQSLATINEQRPLWALSTQAQLWEAYQSNTLGVGSGISAMPSMHVSIAFLLFLFARHKHSVLAYSFGIFCTLTMVGSVHLGWHYAVDGYLSLITTCFIWKISGKVFARHDRLPAPQQTPIEAVLNQAYR